MFVGVYYDKYLGFDFSEYVKWSYFGFNKRLELFDHSAHNDLHNFSGKFIHLVHSECKISKYEFYRNIASDIMKLKKDQCIQFAELMILRENLLKFTIRYNDLTGTQHGTPISHKEGRRTLFATDERNIKEDYGYVIDGVVFYKALNNIDLEDEIILLRQSMDNRQIAKRIEDLDEFIEEATDLLKKIFKSEKKDESIEPIILTRTFVFNNLISWDHQLNAWVKDFKTEHGYFPNIALASTETYARIDLIVNARGKDHLRNPKGESASTEEFVSMNGFKGEGYELDFCMDENLGVNSVRLIYDSDPDGGLPIPEDEEIKIKTTKKMVG